MTHDEMTAALRGEDWPVFDPEDHHEIADRLDRYRSLLSKCTAHLNIDDVGDRVLIAEIRETLK